MNNETEKQIGELELEFTSEQKGPGSLSPHLANGKEDSYIGYDIHPEDVEIVFFEGIGVPRWDSIKADSFEQQEALYMGKYNDVMSKYPMIARSNDTFQSVEYSADEVTSLLAECERLQAESSDPRVARIIQKFVIAGKKAADENVGLTFSPRQ